jgi:hypothetical protein
VRAGERTALLAVLLREWIELGRRPQHAHPCRELGKGGVASDHQAMGRDGVRSQVFDTLRLWFCRRKVFARPSARVHPAKSGSCRSSRRLSSNSSQVDPRSIASAQSAASNDLRMASRVVTSSSSRDQPGLVRPLVSTGEGGGSHDRCRTFVRTTSQLVCGTVPSSSLSGRLSTPRSLRGPLNPNRTTSFDLFPALA